ncbi:hypothetical protein KW797_01445, partial [Candidatus Parcubacteria bacterium]|nr:hypothetical protein [Candidatus Parcubacteria bacterium]
DQIGTVKQSDDLDITSMTTSAYNIFTLNATGRGNVSKTGVTKFAAREGHDFENTSIDVTKLNYVGISTADHTGTTQDPTLTVTYALAAGGKPVIIVLRSLLSPLAFAHP